MQLNLHLPPASCNEGLESNATRVGGSCGGLRDCAAGLAERAGRCQFGEPNEPIGP